MLGRGPLGRDTEPNSGRNIMKGPVEEGVPELNCEGCLVRSEAAGKGERIPLIENAEERAVLLVMGVRS